MEHLSAKETDISLNQINFGKFVLHFLVFCTVTDLTDYLYTNHTNQIRPDTVNLFL